MPAKSPKEWLHAGLRAADRHWAKARSFARLTWFRLLYPGLAIGDRVFIGRGVRVRVLNGATLVIGSGTRIDTNAELHSDGHLTIGNDAYIGAGAIIVAADRIDIGSDALIAAYVTVRDQDHHSEPGAGPFRLQGLETSPVSIGDNAWLGTGSVVLKGVTIGDNCIIGANSVVTRSIPTGVKAAGAPARPIGGPIRQPDQ